QISTQPRRAQSYPSFRREIVRKSRTTRRKQSKVKGSGQECPLHRNKGQRRQPLRHCGNPPFGFAQGQALTSESTTLGWGSDIGKDCQLRYTPLPLVLMESWG